MAGVENITKEILQEAEESAAAIIREAEDKKAAALAEAKEQIAAETEKNEKKAKEAAATYLSRIESKADSDGRRAQLAARSAVISDVIERAKKELLNTDAPAYFDMLADMAEKACHGEAGTMVLSPADVKRLPAGFAEKVNAAAKAKGGSLDIAAAGDPAIDGGFVLKYGGIDENCSISAIFAEKSTDLADIVYRKLWPKE